ncbi:MAG: T9SS type A sorting domain-containing protein [Ignavibacteria bacterium]
MVIQSAIYPVKIKSSKHRLILESDEDPVFKEVLNPGSEVVITDEKIKTLRISTSLIPDRTELYQNYPNPFNPTTKIRFDLKNDARVQLKLFDVIGRELVVLIDEEKNAGVYTFYFDASKYFLTNGIYFYQLIAGDYKSIKKMIYLK